MQSRFMRLPEELQRRVLLLAVVQLSPQRRRLAETGCQLPDKAAEASISI